MFYYIPTRFNCYYTVEVYAFGSATWGPSISSGLRVPRTRMYTFAVVTYSTARDFELEGSEAPPGPRTPKRACGSHAIFGFE